MKSQIHPVYRFEVIDTGPGIARAAQAELFQPFQQAGAGLRKGGTGLGLVIAQRRVELMGGELKFESEPGKGSCFCFEIPLAPAIGTNGVAETKFPAWRLAAGQKITALIVDDVPENRDVLAQMLRSIGAQAEVVESGAAALEFLRTRSAVASPGFPEVVFLDIRMPDMDGKETARRVWEEFGRGRFKLVAISASVLEHERQEYLSLGFDDFLGKPFRYEQVCDSLRRLTKAEFEISPGRSSLDVESQEIDPATVTVPPDLVGRLREAAECLNVTRLEQCLSELEKDGAVNRAVAGSMRKWIDSGDLDAVTQYLDRVERN